MTYADRMTAQADGRATIALCVCGSIASYKAAMVARLLVKAGARVMPVMTHAATKLLGPATLAGITGERVHVDMFDPSLAGELHVELGAQADVVAVVPATAELISGLASGRADDLLRATLLCARGPVLLAPAMHPRMWEHPATRANVKLLEARGVTLCGPVVGEVASGEVGMGRMAEPEAIAAAILARVRSGDLAGKRIVVSAGPTVEDIDPARYLSNRSSGKMGYAIAARAAARGAEVTLVSGPVALSAPHGVNVVHVKSALDMQRALAAALGAKLDGADALVMAAAVADYRPATARSEKIKRGAALNLELVPNPDLLAEIGAARQGKRPVLVGFALETVAGDALVAAARGKLEKKRVDLVVANRADESLGRDDNRVVLVTRDAAREIGPADKSLVAERVLDALVAELAR
jgi:phosphopantothenoylcysteine decarboxylase / phosphopantothenate---cysteine ligase